MTPRFACPACRNHFFVRAENLGRKVSCPNCSTPLNLDATATTMTTTTSLEPEPLGNVTESAWWVTTQESRPLRRVTYLHHSRDRDTDVIMFFTDPAGENPEAIQQSSPVTGIRRLAVAVLDRQGRGNLQRFLVSTRRTDYEVTIDRERADHLAIELGMVLE